MGGRYACGATFRYTVPLPKIFLTRLFSKTRLKRKDFQEIVRLPWAQEAPVRIRAAGAPHPLHRHVHSEMGLIREGTVELAVSGTSYRLGPGSVGFVHSNDEHGIKNVGATPATYFVVAIGPGADS